MSINDDTKLMTSGQLKRRLKSIETESPGIKHELLKYVEQFQKLDHIAASIGLVKNGFSFINRVSWDTVLTALTTSTKNAAEEIKLKDISDTILKSAKQLEDDIIPRLQILRNRWMMGVILLEFVILALAILVVAGGTYMLGGWSLATISFSPLSFLYERPVFSLIFFIVLLFTFVVLHFIARDFVAEQVASKLKREDSELDLAAAFLKNTRIKHSIFRPNIVGFGWLNRKRLQMS